MLCYADYFLDCPSPCICQYTNVSSKLVQIIERHWNVPALMLFFVTIQFLIFGVKEFSALKNVLSSGLCGRTCMCKTCVKQCVVIQTFFQKNIHFKIIQNQDLILPAGRSSSVLVTHRSVTSYSQISVNRCFVIIAFCFFNAEALIKIHF